MVVNCIIEFDGKSGGIYFAGQIVSGKVTLQADKPKQVKGVILEILGCGDTHWSESDSDNKSSSYSAHEDYLNSKTELLSPKNDMVDIVAGIHTFTFSGRIPLTCPSSLECFYYGKIRYMIKVSLIRPWKFNQTFTKPFTVIKYMDINLSDPLYKEPVTLDERKTFCCGPCKSDPLIMELSLPYTAYVPGQNIPVNICIANDSNKNIERFEVELMLTVKFIATGSWKISYLLVSQIRGPQVLKYTKKVFCYSLPVPATPPTDTTNSKIILLSYEVKLVAHVRGAHLKKEIKTPVTIGSIWQPQGLIQQQPGSTAHFERQLMDSAQQANDSNDTKPDIMVDPESKSSAYNHWSELLPPPDYEEAAHMPHGKLNDANDYGDKEFKPKYPVFKILPSPVQEYSAMAEQGTWM